MRRWNIGQLRTSLLGIMPGTLCELASIRWLSFSLDKAMWAVPSPEVGGLTNKTYIASQQADREEGRWVRWGRGRIALSEKGLAYLPWAFFHLECVIVIVQFRGGGVTNGAWTAELHLTWQAFKMTRAFLFSTLSMFVFMFTPRVSPCFLWASANSRVSHSQIAWLWQMIVDHLATAHDSPISLSFCTFFSHIFLYYLGSIELQLRLSLELNTRARMTVQVREVEVHFRFLKLLSVY